MTPRQEAENLLSRLEGEKHRKEVKSCRTYHSCKNKECNRGHVILSGEPAVVITYIINNPNTNKEIYTTKYYHVTCEPK